MADVIESNGSCLCKAVTIQAHTINIHVGACHCGMCRNWGGGPLLAVDCGTDVSFTGEENISIFSSSDWAQRGFCSQCGTHLFYRLNETQQYMMPAGLFNDQKRFILDHQIFIDNKPSFYDFANATTDMTEAEVFAKFADS